MADIKQEAEVHHDSDKEISVSVCQVDSNPGQDLTLWQAVKKWRNVVFCCIGMTSTILLYGYDYVIVGTSAAMPSFQLDLGERYGKQWILPSLWLGLWQFASPGGSIVGSAVGGQVQDWVGRRWSIIMGSFISAAAVGVMYCTYIPDDIYSRRSIFLAGKVLQGFGIGMTVTTTQTYMSEILPVKLRGPILAFFPMFTMLGQLVGAGVIFGNLKRKNGYTLCFASQWPFSVLPMIVAYFVPESPTYLVRKNKMEGALKAQERLEGHGGDAQETIAIIHRNIEHERKLTKATYIDCFRRANLRRTLIVMFAAALPQIFGLSLLSKSSYFGQIVGMSASMSVMLLIVGIVLGLLSNIASIWILHHVRRRNLFIGGLGVTAVLWLGLGISGIWSNKSVVNFSAFSLMAVTVSVGLSAWPASYVVGSEASALHLRAKAQGIGWLTSSATSAIFAFMLPYMYNPDAGNLKGKIGFFFAGLCLICMVISYFCVPEMKDRSPADIDRMFEAKLPARHFRAWTPPSAYSIDPATVKHLQV